MMRNLTWSGVKLGLASNASAATAEVTAAACEVPAAWKYCGGITSSGYSLASAAFCFIVETRCAPGATTSGFTNASRVGPAAEKGVM